MNERLNMSGDETTMVRRSVQADSMSLADALAAPGRAREHPLGWAALTRPVLPMPKPTSSGPGRSRGSRLRLSPPFGCPSNDAEWQADSPPRFMTP
ncbi:hypothetical protein [Streptomyces mirabilis]|uniref:hypothetical protein n=1 Tax=Streptomyces mirabilis TaxID=68239 RepID=UPI0036E2A76A